MLRSQRSPIWITAPLAMSLAVSGFYFEVMLALFPSPTHTASTLALGSQAPAVFMGVPWLPSPPRPLISAGLP